VNVKSLSLSPCSHHLCPFDLAPVASALFCEGGQFLLFLRLIILVEYEYSRIWPKTGKFTARTTLLCERQSILVCSQSLNWGGSAVTLGNQPGEIQSI